MADRQLTSPKRRSRTGGKTLSVLFASFIGWCLVAAAPAFAAIDNTAQAVATYNGNPVVSNFSSVSVPVAPPTDNIALVKSAVINDGGDGHADPGDTITYTFTVTNSGMTTLSNVLLNDPLVTLGAPSLTDNAPAGDSSDGILSAAWDVFGPGDQLTYTATYALTAADLAVAHVANTATVTADTGHSTVVTATDSIDTVLDVLSALTLTKVAALQDGGDGIANAGDVINYTFTVTNTGNTNLTNVTVDDPLLAVADLPGKAAASQMMAALAAGADPMATASTTSFDPFKTFEGEARLYDYVATRQAALFWPGREIPQLPVELGVERKLVMLTGDPGAPKAGDRIGIYFNLSNAGEGPLTTLAVKQQGAEAYGDALAYLAPNVTDTASIIFSRLLTEEDIAAGEIARPAIVTAKSRGRTQTFAVVDALPLAAVSGAEELATASITPATVALLAPGTSTIFTSTLNLTQPLVDAGVVNNTATANGDTPHSGSVTSPPASASTPLPALPGIAMIKQGTVDLGPDGVATVGDVINYTFQVKNTGNVTLHNITVTDTGAVIAGGPIASLAPIAVNSATITATHVLVQADIDAGHYDNQSTATGTAPDNSTTATDNSDDGDFAQDDPTVVTLAAQPKISLLKQLDTSTYANAIEDVNSNGLADLGDRVHYKFTVKNTGNVTLANVYVQDRNAAIITTPLPPTGISLAPGASDTTSFSALYTLTQSDVDAGHFNNTADTYGTAPDSSTVTDESDPAVETQNSPTIITIPAQPAVALLKQVTSIDDVNSSGVTDTNDVIHYQFTVINTGNVTLHGITVTDPNASVSGGSVASLAPGAFDNVTLTATHLVTAADMLAGRVTNQATAHALPPVGAAVTDLSDTSDPTENDPTITPTVIQPGIAILKQVTGITNTNANAIIDAGDTIHYKFIVKNTGNVPLTSVTVTDPLPGITISGAPIPLMDAGDTDSTTFTASYVLTLADVTAGQVANQATATGTAPNTALVTDLSHPSSFTADLPTVTYIANFPSVALVKTMASIEDVNSNSVQDVGDIIHYDFAVHNTGNMVLTAISVSDPNATVSGGPLASLAPSVVDYTSFTGTHVITQADLDAGQVTNQATVNATSPTGPLTDLSDESSVTGNDPTVTSLTQVPGISILKTVQSITDVNGNSLVDQGDKINYRFAIYNTGNVTLHNVVLTDTNATLSPATPLATLPTGPTPNTSYTAVHVVTAADQIAEEVLNQASVVADDGAGGSVSDLSDEADLNGDGDTTTKVAAPPVVLTKTAAKSQIIRGERVAYTITASSLKTGPYNITDMMPPGFSYVAGSATVNGVATAPAGTGNTLTFASVTPDSSKRIIIKLQLLSSTTLSTGDFINKAQITLTSTGQVLGNAQARVTVKDEPVFDCSDVIGRVFDDLNANGYADDGEPGLPGVRIATVKGVLITTDKNGRYHVPCADVPDPMTGSNYLLKLDTRTLPAGYELTTENPRDVRITRGTMVKLNFGASRNRDVALELRRDAFASDGVILNNQWIADVDRLVGLMGQQRSDLSIVYRCNAYAPIADDRVAAVKALVIAKWKAAGHDSDPVIKTKVECGP
jgi:uncharacterized repeat protein (TIGR01451 family)